MKIILGMKAAAEEMGLSRSTLETWRDGVEGTAEGAQLLRRVDSASAANVARGSAARRRRGDEPRFRGLQEVGKSGLAEGKGLLRENEVGEKSKTRRTNGLLGRNDLNGSAMCDGDAREVREKRTRFSAPGARLFPLQ